MPAKALVIIVGMQINLQAIEFNDNGYILLSQIRRFQKYYDFNCKLKTIPNMVEFSIWYDYLELFQKLEPILENDEYKDGFDVNTCTIRDLNRSLLKRIAIVQRHNAPNIFGYLLQKYLDLGGSIEQINLENLFNYELVVKLIELVDISEDLLKKLWERVLDAGAHDTMCLLLRHFPDLREKHRGYLEYHMTVGFLGGIDKRDFDYLCEIYPNWIHTRSEILQKEPWRTL